jgi:hypothetical protein
MAEDGAVEAHGSRRRPVSGRGQPAWLVHPPRKASDSNAKVSPPHPLATEPSAPVWFTFRTVPGIRTPTTRDLNAVPLAIGLGRHASG